MPPPPDLKPAPRTGPASSAPRLRSERLLGKLEHFGVRLGLERVRALLDADPEDPLAIPTVLVGGTNGKGSTASLLEAIARAAGLRTGLYTSPHLEDVRERVRVDGRPIADADLARELERILGRAEGAGLEPPTYFEAMTLAGLSRFRRTGVELAILEVGLGGRLDATNAARPILSLITSIGLDHTNVLGDTMAAIAREKAGILREGGPAFAWVDDPAAEAALVEEAERIGARLTLAHRICRVGRDLASARVEITTPSGTRTLECPLPGAHQGRNLALAVLAADHLREHGFPGLDEATTARGVAATRWAGRLERVVLPGGGDVLLDAAHNPQGIEALVRHLESLSGPPPDLLFGALGDRDGAAMLADLRPRVARMILTRPGSPRATDPADLARGLPDAEVEDDPAAALARVLPEPGRTLVVAGSIYLLGTVRRELRRRFGVPPAMVEG